jgi:glycosyltransferase involved in cell wall biosynthesis
MRILFLLDTFQEDETGIALFRILERLAAIREISLQVAAFEGSGPLAERLREISIGTRLIPWRGLRDAKRMKELGRQLIQRADRPDVIMSLCAWPALAARFLHGGVDHVPLICALTGLTPERKPGFLAGFAQAAAEKTTRRWISAITVPSHGLMDELIGRGYGRELVYRIPLGIDALQVFPLSESGRARYRMLASVGENQRLIIYTSRDHADRDREALHVMRTFDSLHERGHEAVLFLLGDGYGEEVRAAAETRGGRVRVIGSLTQATGKLYSAADVLIRGVMPRTWPIGAIEAQASGTPLIALIDPSEPGFSPELDSGRLRPLDELHPLQKAVVLPKWQVGVLAEALDELITNPEAARELGADARDFVREHYELGNCMEALTELWRTLAPEASWKATDSIPSMELEAIQRESNGGE